MNIAQRLLFLICLAHTLDKIESLDKSQMEKIKDEYFKKISGDIGNIKKDLDKNLEYLVQDVEPHKFNKNLTDVRIIVLDMGGTYFKIAQIEIDFNEGAIVDYRVVNTVEIEYPRNEKNIKEKYWHDWAAEKLVSYVKKNDITPDFCSIVFSYPICYKGDQVFPCAFTKFFCFEKEESLSHEIMTSINDSILYLLENKYSGANKCLKRGLQIKSVLNDAVANYFYSKSKESSNSVAIILGTGTNAAFSFEANGNKYVYNSEWGAFVPEMKTLPEEQEILKEMKSSGVTINFLDTIAANGCRIPLLNRISKKRNLGFRNIDKNNIQEIAKNTNAPEHEYYRILSIRSKQILVSLLAAVISIKEQEQWEIILNGSGFNDKEDCDEFIEMTIDFLRYLGIQSDITYSTENNLVLIGSAFYTVYKILH
ncbi:uncharacterized protein LOC123719054 [Pieris brassicae]|uniref:uncharacterized protein LOC123719054 n=1 Tax=Pieris brassicae TaxID=7116 RepID=UPI001E661766|nr:uncharacterized protein LOC123719054 [Pieris brassicae]